MGVVFEGIISCPNLLRKEDMALTTLVWLGSAWRESTGWVLFGSGERFGIDGLADEWPWSHTS